MKAVQMSSNNTFKADNVNQNMSIDPMLLFQRLISVANHSDIDTKDTLSYELCSSPQSLFDKNGFMRPVNKAVLAESLCALTDIDTAITLTCDDQYTFVLDGGALLYKIAWNKGSTFYDIIKSYVDYINAQFRQNTGADVIVVFDHYGELPSTKYQAHI